MASSAVLFCEIFFVLYLCFFQQGWAQTCAINSIQITETGTGRMVGGNFEFEGIVTNICRCSQANLLVSCGGFDGTETDPSLIKKVDDDHCLINDGKPIHEHELIKFKFVSWGPFTFVPQSSQINC